MAVSAYLLGHPSRPVDVRFRRAEEITQMGGRITRYDDTWTAKLVSFLRKLVLCCTRSDLVGLECQHPAIYLAFRVYKEASLDFRSTLEARLLTLEPNQEIAKKTNLTEASIEAYRSAFFDLQNRRECVDYVVSDVIGRPSEMSSEAEVEGCLKKTIGYFFGSNCLDGILYPGVAGERMMPRSADDAMGTLVQGVRRYKATLLLLQLTASNPADRRELLKEITPKVATKEESVESLTSVERHIQAMLSELPWVTGQAARGVVPERMLEVDSYAAELESEELMRFAAGELPAEVIDEIKGVRIPFFPPPESLDPETDSTGHV